MIEPLVMITVSGCPSLLSNVHLMETNLYPIMHNNVNFNVSDNNEDRLYLIEVIKELYR